MPRGPDEYSEDGWDMSERRVAAVMAETHTPEFASSDLRLPRGRGVLSAAEIEALLRPDLDDMPVEEPAPVAEAKPHRIVDFEATEPDTCTPDQAAAERLAARLSLSLRRDCGLHLAARVESVRTQPFRDAPHAAPSGGILACYTGPAGEVSHMLILPMEAIDAIIEAAAGGQPGPQRVIGRTLTPLDTALLDGLLRPLAPIFGTGARFCSLETDADFAAAISPPGAATHIGLTLRGLGGAFPSTLVTQPLEVRSATETVDKTRPVSAPAMTAIMTARIARLSVPLSRLSGLKPGSTLLLGLPADQPVELLSGGRDGDVAIEGDIGRSGERMAIRVRCRRLRRQD